MLSYDRELSFYFSWPHLLNCGPQEPQATLPIKGGNQDDRDQEGQPDGIRLLDLSATGEVKTTPHR